MTNLALDPAKLSLFYPKASVDTPQKVRIIAQVVDYDLMSGLLAICRVPNIGSLHTEIDLDDIGDSDEAVAFVDTSSTIFASTQNQDFFPGAIVNIIGFYDGKLVTSAECCTLREEALIGSSIETLAAMATLHNL